MIRRIPVRRAGFAVALAASLAALAVVPHTGAGAQPAAAGGGAALPAAAGPQSGTVSGSPPGAAVGGRDSVLEARTSALASVLRCPVCQGLSIQDSPTELAQQMRAVVREQFAAGKSEREVKAYFVSKYGEWILLSPEPRGFNLLVYILPAALLLAGAGAVAMLVRRWTAAPAQVGGDDSGIAAG